MMITSHVSSAMTHQYLTTHLISTQSEHIETLNHHDMLHIAQSIQNCHEQQRHSQYQHSQHTNICMDELTINDQQHTQYHCQDCSSWHCSSSSYVLLNQSVLSAPNQSASFETTLNVLYQFNRTTYISSPLLRPPRV
ncbi:hypothetical protein F4V57_12635 [Acinetobacter qingfengensis]|nr:hypothetical protein [Acinetobacter qingfengensis]KAA8731427.1 hypothetical protein F4V57_12635 [Acinetobacter qingfengensis]